MQERTPPHKLLFVLKGIKEILNPSDDELVELLRFLSLWDTGYVKLISMRDKV